MNTVSVSLDHVHGRKGIIPVIGDCWHVIGGSSHPALPRLCPARAHLHSDTVLRFRMYTLSWHGCGQGTVDYIFYGPASSPSNSPTVSSRSDSENECGGSNTARSGDRTGGCLRCLGVAEPPLRCELDKFQGLPSPEEPSDHVLLAARFGIFLPN